MAMTKPGDLLNYTEVAEILGVSAESLQKGYLGFSRIPKIRIGRLIRFRRSEVERWIEDNTREPYNYRPEKAVRRSA